MTEFRPSRFQILPVIVKNIIIINVLVSLLQLTLGRFHYDMSVDFGLHYWKSPLFKPWQLITHMFVHGSYNDVQLTILHLFSNMFGLWMFGSILENVWGPRLFLIFYLLCGLGAAICHLTVLHVEFTTFNNDFLAYKASPTLDHFMSFIKSHAMHANPPFLDAWRQDPGNIHFPQSSVIDISKYQNASINEATVGASGAVFGVLFAFGYLFPNTMIYLYFFLPLKAKYFVALYALFELSSGIQNSAGDNIAHFAHLGGMLAAFILLRLWKMRPQKIYN